MNGINAIFDTNILIDYLLGHKEAQHELKKYEKPQISIITKMEVLVGTKKNNEQIIREFLNSFYVVDLNNDIVGIAVIIKQEHKIKLPDAIIWATAKYKNCILVTRNIKDFSEFAIDIRIPYSL